MDAARIFVGFDQREAIAYHVCCQSIVENSSMPVEFHPLARNHFHNFDGQRDGTNAFTVSRYLVPLLCDFKGKAIFIDGDMVFDSDIAELWHVADSNVYRAVSVVKHDYKTRSPLKYVGSKLEAKNLDYPRKNWSSVMVWDCAHFANRVLTEDFVREAEPTYLHRLQWLKDDDIGSLFQTWNYLVSEDAPSSARNYHYTLGVPGIEHYADDHASWHWHQKLLKTLECAGENPVQMVMRAWKRIGDSQ